jgi:hypothetical protein
MDNPDATANTETMLRRAALACIGLGGFVLAGGNGGVGAPRSAVPVTFSVDAWHETVGEYGFDYLIAPRRRLLADLVLDLDLIRRDMLFAPEERAKALAVPAAQLAALVALTCTSLAYLREARHVWRWTREMADWSGDLETRLWVRGNEIIAGIYQPRPVATLLSLAEQAAHLITAARPTPGHIHVLLGTAQVRALAGDDRGAVSAFTHAANQLSAYLPNSLEQPRTMFSANEGELHHVASFVQARVADFSAASHAHEAALGWYGSSTPSRSIRTSIVQIELHRALSLVRRGDAAGGAAHAVEVVDTLDAELVGPLVLANMAHVHAAVTPHDRRRPSVVELRDRLANVGRA